MVSLYRIFTFFAHDVMQAPGDSVTNSVNYTLKKMSRADLLALRDSATLLYNRVETELHKRD